MDRSIGDSAVPMLACPVCPIEGRIGSLTKYHISLDEQITMCNNDLCFYMDDGSIPDLITETELEAVGTCNEPMLLPDSRGQKNFTNQTASSISRTSSCHDPNTIYIMLWRNIDALCWMDVLLCNLCHNGSVRRAVKTLPYSSVIKKLILTFDEAQEMLRPLQQGVNKLLHSVLDYSDSHIKRGGGCCVEAPLSVQPSDIFSSQAKDSARRNLNLAYLKMGCAREEVWLKIEHPLKCLRGKDNSPVMALPVLLSLERSIEALYLTKYSTSYNCTSCDHSQTTDSCEAKMVVNIAKPPDKVDLSVRQMIYTENCVRCSTPSTVTMHIESLSSNMVMHFAEGLTILDCDNLSFTLPDGRRYVVSAVVEYKSSPNHFALWQRNLAETKYKGEWMLYDDLQSQYGQFNQKQPVIPPHNVHMVFWECVNHVAPSSTTQQTAVNTTTSTKPKTFETCDDMFVKCEEDKSTSTVIATPLIKRNGSKSNLLSNRSRSFIPPPTSIATSSQPAKRTKSSPSSAPESTTAQLGLQTPTSMRAFVPDQGYSNIIQDLNIGSSKVVFQTQSASSSLLSSSNSTKKPARSYLDLVKPLLDKSKQKKSFSGYVPLSQRNADSTPSILAGSGKSSKGGSPSKKVKFTKDTNSRPSTPTLAQQAPIPNPTSNNLSAIKSTNKPGNQKVNVFTRPSGKSDFRPTSDTVPVGLTSAQGGSCDMPDLNDLFNMISN